MWKRTTESRQRAADADAATVYARALALLGRREHAPSELRRKLVAAGLPNAHIDLALNRLAEDGALSAERYADAVARTRLRQGHGPRRIQAELRQQGIDSEAITEAVQQLDADWLRQATSARRRRFGDALPTATAERVRQTRYLLQRGFTSDIVRQVLRGDGPAADSAEDDFALD